MEAYRDGEGSLPELATRFRVSEGWAKKISSALLHTGQMERPAGRKRGRQSKVTVAVLEYLGSLVAAQPDLTLEKLQASLERDRKIHLSIGRLWLVLKQMGLRSKKSLHAAEQDTAKVRAQRERWQQETRQINPARLVFLDESGVTTEMTRRYGRARLHEGVPAGHWRTMTVLGAIGVSGWVGIMTIEAATDGDVFLAYLDHVLCPQLRPGQIVVMDNLGAHKVDGVAQRIRQTGPTLLYLPPYSPDFNPIEKCWAQIKQRLRVLKAPSLPSLQDALADALGTLTPQNTAAYFQHCGYGL